MWRHALPPGEEPLALAVLRLRDTMSGATEPMVAVGTCLPLGEVGQPPNPIAVTLCAIKHV